MRTAQAETGEPAGVSTATLVARERERKEARRSAKVGARKEKIGGQPAKRRRRSG